MLSFAKSYELPLAKGYVAHWGMVEGVREIIQNALDSDSPFEYEFTADSLTVRSRHSKLEPRSLLLGATTKAERTDAIGSFGEGYKLACLALIRAGYPVTIHNGDRTWTPTFVHSKQFDAEVLCFDDRAAASKTEGLAFEISGLSPADVASIRDSCLFMQDHIGAIIDTPQGLILRERPGMLYVGGLFVCKTELEFGYSVKPEHLKLERDRQTVSSFDLLWLSKEMWFASERWDEVAQLMERDANDLRYAEHGCPEMVKDACYRHFKTKNPGKVIAKNQEELDKLVKNGMTQVLVSHSSSYAYAIQTSAPYMATEYVSVRSPQEVMEEWFEKNRRHMRKDAIVAFKGLLNEAGGWRLK